MKGIVWCAGLLTFVLGAAVAPRAARAELASCDLPKVDNFIVFDDQSGSMYQEHAQVGEVKQALAKRTMLELNQEVPSKFCCLNSGLDLFAPYEELKVPYVHDRASFATRIGWIPDSQPVALRLTPMADGFEQLTPVVSGLKGKTAVIVITDGGSNTGGDPIEAARALVAAKPGTCLHVVSLADCDRGREINKALAQITPECRSVEATDVLGSGPKMQQFAHDVFCLPRPPAPRRGG
jgi:OOP family OmpA-OmpF porin